MKPYSFVKLNKAIINDDIFKNEKRLKFYIWLLCKATYKESDIFVGNVLVHLNKGELIFGLNSASSELGISIRSLRCSLEALKRANKIAVKTTNKFSVITLLDKEIYSWSPPPSVIQNDIDNGTQNDNNKEYIENKNNRRYYTRTPKKIKYAYAGYDLDLYEKMLNEQD